VRVWLSAAHRATGFLTRRAGRDLVASLGEVWRAAGCLTRRRQAALDRHLERVREAARGRARPGSWSWPRLRAEAEGRFARGEPASLVARELRARHAPDHARVPSLCTFWRWFAEGRWLRRAPARALPPAPPARPGRLDPPRPARQLQSDQPLAAARPP
jgi:hypothetical protein